MSNHHYLGRRKYSIQKINTNSHYTGPSRHNDNDNELFLNKINKYFLQASLQGNGGATKANRRQSILSVAWTDVDTGVEKIMWREIDKVSRIVFPGLFLVFVILYWPALLLKSSAI